MKQSSNDKEVPLIDLEFFSGRKMLAEESHQLRRVFPIGERQGQRTIVQNGQHEKSDRTKDSKCQSNAPILAPKNGQGGKQQDGASQEVDEENGEVFGKSLGVSVDALNKPR